MNADNILQDMQTLAKKNNVELTDTAINIARFRARAGLPLSVCPCSPLDKERGCISKKCLDEIQTLNTCHCRAYKKIVDKG